MLYNNSMEKLTNRQIQALETKQKIINSACELLKEHTLEKITVQQICKQANISIGAFYHHFKTKEDIIYSLFFTFDDWIKEVLIHKEYPSSIDAIVDLLYHESAGALDYGLNITAEIIKLTVRQNETSVYDNQKRFFHTYLIELIEKAKKEKLILDIDTNYLASLLLRHTRGIGYDWVAHHGNYNLEEVLKNDLILLLRNYMPIHQD